jgi:hypothetical protein
MKRRLILFFILYLAFIWQSSAQDVPQAYFTSEVDTPLIGEPIFLLLTVDVHVGAKVTFPQFPAEWPPFVVREVGEVTLVSDTGHSIYQQRLSVILWRPGAYQTPEMAIAYQLPDADGIQQIWVQPAYFVVESVLNPDDLNLRPLKPPISLPFVSPLLIGIVAIGFLFAGAYAWKMRERWMLARVSFAQADTLHLSARLALSDLMELTKERSTPSKIYVVAGNALRRYVQGRFVVPAEDMTTAELMSSLICQESLSERRQHELMYLLEQSDLVKFAHLQPQPKSAEKIVEVSQRWIMAVEQEHTETIG